MATVLAHNSIRVAGKQHISVGSHALQTYPEDATEEFNAGAPLFFSGTNGRVAEITDPVADVEKIVGIAGHDASGVTDTNVVVIPALPAVVFDAILGNVADDLYETSIDDVGNTAALRRDDTNDSWYLGANDDEPDTAAPPPGGCCRIVGLKDPAGTVNGRVYFVFRDSRQNAGDTALIPSTIYA